MIVAFFNFKGGVGKTSTTENIGAALRERGHSVALFDLDTQRNLKGATPLAADAVEKAVKKSKHEYSLLDCPPSLGPESGAALRVADLVVVPLQPEPFALQGLAALLETMKAAQARGYAFDYRILLTMMDVRIRLCREIESAVRERFGARVLPTAIRESSKFIEASARGISVIEHAPKSPGAVAYRAACRELFNFDE